MNDAAEVCAYIGVGANIEPEKNTLEALTMLAAQTRLLAVSTFYRSLPADGSQQPPFLNGVVCVETALAPDDLKSGVLRRIESALGRVRGPDRYAPRCIDLDVLVYGQRVIDEDGLCVPDPDIRERPFVAVPLLEIAPDLVLPDTGEKLVALPAAHASAELEPLMEFSARLRERLLK